MTIHNRIEGIFTLTTPLHCASTDASLASAGATTETPTMQRRIMTREGVTRIPIFPGNGLRGGLRRKAAKIVLDQIAAKDKVEIALYQGLNCASITGQPESGLSVEEVLRARDNLYMGLFGGGARMLRSRYRVNDLIPVLADTIAVGSVPQSFGDVSDSTYTPQNSKGAANGWSIIETATVLRVDDVMRVMRPHELEKYVANAANAVREIQLGVMDERAQRKVDKLAIKDKLIGKEDIQKKSTIENIMSYQAIMAGTPMYFLLDFQDDCSDKHIGMMLLALRDLVREQALGGWVRAGLGRYTTNLTLTRDGEAFPVFTSNAAAGDATLSAASQTFADVATEAMSLLSADDMMAFFLPREVAQDAVEKVAGKGNKAAKQKTPEAG